MIAIDPLVGTIVRLGLSVLFAFAAWHKLRDPVAFRAAATDYQLVPARLLGAFALALPLVESAVAVGLIWPDTARAAGVAGAGLLGLYSGAIGINLLRGRRRIECGCFGPAARRELDEWLLARNGALVVACLCGALPAGDRALGLLDLFVCAAGSTTIFALWSALSTMTEPRLRGQP